MAVPVTEVTPSHRITAWHAPDHQVFKHDRYKDERSAFLTLARKWSKALAKLPSNHVKDPHGSLDNAARNQLDLRNTTSVDTLLAVGDKFAEVRFHAQHLVFLYRHGTHFHVVGGVYPHDREYVLLKNALSHGKRPREWDEDLQFHAVERCQYPRDVEALPLSPLDQSSAVHTPKQATGNKKKRY